MVYKIITQQSDTKLHLNEISDLYFKLLDIFFESRLNFSDDNFENVELKKGLIKGSLIYSQNTNSFMKKIERDLINTFQIKKKIENSQYPYIMFHLVNDSSEAGSFHIDSKFKSYTLWSPLVDYSCPGISFFWPGYFIFKIFKFFKLVSFANIFTIKIAAPKKNNTYCWNGNTPHKGLFNFSENPIIAMTMSFTEESLSKNKIGGWRINGKNQEDFNNIKIDFQLLLKDFENIGNFIRNHLLNLEKEAFNSSVWANIFNKVNELKINYQMIASFALSQLGRALFFKKNKNNSFFYANLIDLLAITLNTEDVSSKHRIEISNFCKNYKIII
jgi:hypothetical protein